MGQGWDICTTRRLLGAKRGKHTTDTTPRARLPILGTVTFSPPPRMSRRRPLGASRVQPGRASANPSRPPSTCTGAGIYRQEPSSPHTRWDSAPPSPRYGFSSLVRRAPPTSIDDTRSTQAARTAGRRPGYMHVMRNISRARRHPASGSLKEPKPWAGPPPPPPPSPPPPRYSLV